MTAAAEPRDMDRATVLLAIARSRAGLHEEAIQLLSEVARRRPADASVRADLAMALLQAGRVQEALGGFSEALRLDARSAQAQCGLGLAYQRLDRWEEAAEAFRMTEKLAPDQPIAPLNLGLALHALGEREEARRALLRAAALAPDDDEIREALSALESDAGRTGSPAPGTRFSGDLGSFGLPEVLELMRVQRKTGALVISSPRGAGIVRLVQGRLISASAPAGSRASHPVPEGARPDLVLRQIVGELAEIVRWREGAFSFHPSGDQQLPAVSFDTQRVVMELFREEDR